MLSITHGAIEYLKITLPQLPPVYHKMHSILSTENIFLM